MSSLTAKYRPRRFADVAGQDAVKSILSRAAATGKIAPAYMFSGTRGVGKTTIARIFAKALNCEKAPTAEPCNECRLCRQANAGNAVDIVEIDAASHGGVNDVRSLKEDVGYAPLEGRYKVFIIDEAHMLSTAAFNALLKTLEEPPARVTFILASTEAHKFPATILSRCQHYVFKMLPQAELAAHLEKILKAENVEYEPGAVRIIARRGAGSVRDSISLLGQALAYSAGSLIESEVRACLGLAGQEVFFALMEAIAGRDLPLLTRTLRQVLDQGLDLGFFLRELSGCWRNMFLLRQGGEAMAAELGLPAEEARQWLDWSGRFTPAHIHACWQMTLDGQQRVIKSLEPAQALELLLLNLACLPDLLPLSVLGGGSANGAGGGPSGGPSQNAPRGPAGGQGGHSTQGGAPRVGQPQHFSPRDAAPPAAASGTSAASPTGSGAAGSSTSADAASAHSAPPPPWRAPASGEAGVSAPSHPTSAHPASAGQASVHPASAHSANAQLADAPLAGPSAPPPSAAAHPIDAQPAGNPLGGVKPAEAAPSVPTGPSSAEAAASDSSPAESGPMAQAATSASSNGSAAAVSPVASRESAPDAPTAPQTEGAQTAAVPDAPAAPQAFGNAAPIAAPHEPADSSGPGVPGTSGALAAAGQPAGPAGAPSGDGAGVPGSAGEPRPRPSGERTWEGFVEFVTAQNGNGFVTGLMQARGELCDAELVLTCHNETHIHMMEEGDNNARLRRLVADYFGPDVTVAFVCPEHAPIKTEGTLQREMQDHPLVQRVRETFECRDPALVVPRR